jgi:hypothetical protein
MPASPPDAGWQTLHGVFGACSPPECSTLPAGTGSENAVVSWHDVHVSMVGCVLQRSACEPAWHVSQRATFCGKPTVEKSWTLLPKPMIWYGVPATTLGSSFPRWMRWIMILKSTVLPVSGSLDCGWWQVTHCVGLVQRPPCAASDVPWHDEQV